MIWKYLEHVPFLQAKCQYFFKENTLTNVLLSPLVLYIVKYNLKRLAQPAAKIDL